MLELVNISKNFNKVNALDDVSLSIDKGVFFAVLGSSGCGKSTLLNIIAGLIKPDKGEVIIDELNMKDTPPNKRNIGMIFQDFFVYPHLNVFENISYPLKLQKIYNKNETEKKVKEIAGYMNISDLLERKGFELSGGEKQRVALARAIVKSPLLFLLDEPLSSLDYQLKLKIRSELKKIHRDLGKTFVYVTHDQTDAIYLADKVAVMDKGKIIQVGAPKEIITAPQNIFVAKFIHSYYNIMPANLMKGNTNGSVVLSSKIVDISIDNRQLAQKLLNVKPQVNLFILAKDLITNGQEAKRDENSLVHFKGEITDSIINSDFHHIFLNNGLEMTLMKSNHKVGDIIDVSIEKKNILIFDKEERLIGKAL